jgi:cellulose synthase/poly-beta-1,6-N-acetylglucosamine synthase-like glycosyltransferase
MPYISKNSPSIQSPFINTLLNERLLDAIPGGIAWLSLLLCLVLAFFFPKLLLLGAGLLALYSGFRFVTASIFSEMGQRQIRDWEKIDWYARYGQEANPMTLAWDDIYHVVIIPNYQEPIQILRRTLENLCQQYEASKRIIIVLAMEAGETNVQAKAETLRHEYESYFKHFFITYHPQHLRDEIPGKSANQTWAARQVKTKLIDDLKYNVKHLLVTTMDADTLWHPRHFEALTYFFAIDPHRWDCLWQAPIRYHANFWDVNPLFRLLNACASGFELAYIASPFWLHVPISSYALSFQLLIDSRYWDTDVISDEYHTLVKAYFARKGKLQIRGVMLPFLALSPAESKWLDTARVRYQQTVRHTYASKEVGYLIAQMLENPQYVTKNTFRLLFRFAHDVLLAGAGWVIITAGIQLPFLLKAEIDTPVLIMIVLSGVLVFIASLVFWYQDFCNRPLREDAPHPNEYFLSFGAFLLLPLLTLVFVALPTLQSQTLLLLGQPLHFNVTKK